MSAQFPSTSAAARETSDSVARLIGDLGAKFMMDPVVLMSGQHLGLAPLAFYFCGRGGVLGDVDADVVTAAFGFMAPDFVAANWSAGADVPRRATALAFAAAAHSWGDQHLPGSHDLARIADLAERIAAAQSVPGLPLFAAWRALRPEDVAPDPSPNARAIHWLHVLRELRGGLHVAATVAEGLVGYEAALASGGTGTAKFLGWGDVDDRQGELKPRWQVAEDVTAELAARPFGVLTDAELGEFRELIHALTA